MIRIEFHQGRSPKLYAGRHLEIREAGTQIRFYEVNGKSEYCLNRDTVKYLMKKGVLPRLKVLKQALKRDKSIFNG